MTGRPPSTLTVPSTEQRAPRTMPGTIDRPRNSRPIFPLRSSSVTKQERAPPMLTVFTSLIVPTKTLRHRGTASAILLATGLPHHEQASESSQLLNAASPVPRSAAGHRCSCCRGSPTLRCCSHERSAPAGPKERRRWLWRPWVSRLAHLPR